MQEVARAAIRRRAAGEAQAALDAYRARYPRGVMSSEASILQIEVTAIGNPGSARAAALDYLERSPRGLYAARMRAVAGVPEP